MISNLSQSTLVTLLSLSIFSAMLFMVFIVNYFKVKQSIKYNLNKNYEIVTEERERLSYAVKMMRRSLTPKATAKLLLGLSIVFLLISVSFFYITYVLTR